MGDFSTYHFLSGPDLESNNPGKENMLNSMKGTMEEKEENLRRIWPSVNSIGCKIMHEARKDNPGMSMQVTAAGA